MADIGYNDNVKVAGRKFHIQTASNINKGYARCEVFEAGRVITTHHTSFERRGDSNSELLERRIRKIVEDLHQETKVEIELMFQIAEKIKKLKHAPSNVKVGLMFLQNNLIKDAIEQFEIAINLDPKSIIAIKHLAVCYIKEERIDEAIELLEKAIEEDSKFADIHFNLGKAYFFKRQYEKAIRHFNEALKLNPQYYAASYHLAMTYLDSIVHSADNSLLPPSTVRFQRSQQLLEHLYSQDLYKFTGIYPQILKALNEKKIAAAVKILNNNQDVVFPLNVLGLIGIDFYLKFMYGGKNLDADVVKKYEEKLVEASKTHPNYADIWNNLGIVHLIQCRNLFLQALTEFDKALEINPSFNKALKNKKLVENDGKEFLILLRAILR